MTRIIRISGMNRERVNRVNGVFCGKQCRCKNRCDVNYKGEKIPLSKCKNWCKAVKPNTDKLPADADQLFRGTISNSGNNSTNTVVSNQTGTGATASTSLTTLTATGGNTTTATPTKNSKLLIGGALVGAAALLYYFTS